MQEELEELEIDQIPLDDSFSEYNRNAPLDPEMLEIEMQKKTDIMILEYKSYKAIHPRLAKLSEVQFNCLSYDEKEEYVDEIEQHLYHNKNKNHPKHPLVKRTQVITEDKNKIQKLSIKQMKLYIDNAANKQKIKMVQHEAFKQMETLKIQRLLDQYDDPESKALKEYFMNNDDVEVKLNTLGVRDVYLSLSDPQQRKNLLALIYGNKNEQKKYKLKEWQMENQHQKNISEKIKLRYKQKLQNQQEDFQYASDQEEDKTPN